MCIDGILQGVVPCGSIHLQLWVDDLDLDWEYPAFNEYGGKNNYALMMK